MSESYYATGSNGSVIEFDNGRFADTVNGDTSENMSAGAAMAAMLDESENMKSVNSPFGDFDADEIAEYVGA